MIDKDPKEFMITVVDLIEKLSKLDPTAYVVLQRDSEGNGYSPMAGIEAAKYRPKNTYRGEVPHPDDIKNGEYEEEDIAKMLDCVVIFPIN